MHNERFTFNIKNNDSDLILEFFSPLEKAGEREERVDGWIDSDLKWFLLEVLKLSKDSEIV